jgi:Holliday junction resolvase-like predicted endonuclease
MINNISFENIIASVIIFILILIILKYKLSEYFKKRKLKKRFERGKNLENKARKFLQKKGFSILKSQHQFYHKYSVNGKMYSSEIIPDYIVKKNGKIYIVEVKSGRSAIAINNSNTRRQLLEYDFVINCDGIFLLDMENEKMELIKFYSKPQKQNSQLLAIAVLLALSAVFINSFYLKIVLSAAALIILFRNKFYFKI